MTLTPRITIHIERDAERTYCNQPLGTVRNYTSIRVAAVLARPAICPQCIAAIVAEKKTPCPNIPTN